MTLKVYLAIYVFLGKSGIYVFKSKQYIYQFTSLDFHITPVGFVVSPLENLLLGLTLEKFWEFGIFPGESGVRTRVLRQGVYIDIFIPLTLILIQHASIISSYIDFCISRQNTFFIFKKNFYKKQLKLELMTLQAVSFEKVFHWTKFLAFESQKFVLLKCFMKV